MEDIRFDSSVVFVADVDVSRRFYEGLLGQTVLFDHGLNVAYEGGFAIWQAEHAVEIIMGRSTGEKGSLGRLNLELYFESEDLDAAWSTVSGADVEIIQPIHEEPWAQRTFRFYDPDGHIVEIGEPMNVVIRRHLKRGMTAEEVSERTSMPIDMVRAVEAGDF